MSAKRATRRRIVIDLSPDPSPVLAPIESMEPILANVPTKVEAPDLASPEPLLPDMEMPDVGPLEPRIPSLDECLAALLALFPDIDSQYVRAKYEEHIWNEGVNVIELLVDLVLDAQGNYPKIQREGGPVKRKRERSPSEMTAEELDHKYNYSQRVYPGPAYVNLSRKHLRNAFPFIPATTIDAELQKSRNFLFPAYKKLAQEEAGYDKAHVKPYKKLGRPRKAVIDDILLREGERLGMDEHTSLLDEFAAAQRIYMHLTVKSNVDTGASGSIELMEGSADEALFECGCCFGEVTFLQLTQCSDGHLFCLDCGRRNAETEIGQQKYKLVCMDASGCKKEFPIQEVKRFCDEKMLEALERLEQRDVLRKAEIDGLSECPFCDFAAILPPVEADREFRCQNPDCMKVSCRLCDKETHIPLTCEEKAKEENSSLRRNVEEAMTEALLRKCGKCGLPYVKESGCNKIVCSRCSAINCYLCSKVIKDYKHFNDVNRGGKSGNCLLFDNTDERHHNEVQAAEQAAINKIRAENPDISEEEMRVRLSKVVLDGERQKIDEGNRRLGILNPPAVAIGPVAVAQPALQPPNALFLRAFHPAHVGFPVQVPQVIYQPVQVPFQPILVPHIPPNPIPMVPQALGIPHPPAQFHQELRHPLIQAPPLPILGNPVPFIAGNPPMIPVMPPAQPHPPHNIFQRVAAIARPVIRPRAVPIQALVPPPAPLAQAQAVRGIAQNQWVMHQMPIPQANPPAPPPAQENAGFIQRNFNLGGNRLVARGRQAVRNQPNVQNMPRPLTFIDHNIQGIAAQNAVANDKQPMPNPRNRPAKIAKRGSR
ncbi:hypothetical protein ABW21_db0207934 [Orbilia brochopaga]|nr:hypothetical protein ABW21_db0207934 [Drechslerella brochopaga]